MSDKIEVIETAEQVLAKRMAPEEIVSKKDVTGGRVESGTSEEEMLKVFARKHVDPLHATDIAEIRDHMHLHAPLSSLSRQRTMGMTSNKTMRLAGSIPEEIWSADELLRPRMTPQERARDLLRRFPEYRIGQLREG